MSGNKKNGNIPSHIPPLNHGLYAPHTGYVHGQHPYVPGVHHLPHGVATSAALPHPANINPNQIHHSTVTGLGMIPADYFAGGAKKKKSKSHRDMRKSEVIKALAETADRLGVKGRVVIKKSKSGTKKKSGKGKSKSKSKKSKKSSKKSSK